MTSRSWASVLLDAILDGMTIRVGISGWTYAPWRERFYPADLPHRRELEYASRRLRSIEINGTFYSLQRPESYARWRDQTPEDFVFSVKAPRFITHVLRLENARVPLANFFASGVLRLGPKLGPVLWQLPPSFRYDRARLETFFRLLPRTTRQAALLAEEHDDHLRARAWLRIDADEPLRHALEIRHESFRDGSFLALLRAQNVALVTADTAGKWPLMEEQTADFAYARLHGDKKLYASGYTPEALARWARRVRRWTRGGRDAYVYFDNDVKAYAPRDAAALARLLGSAAGPAAHAVARRPVVVAGARGRRRRRTRSRDRVRRARAAPDAVADGTVVPSAFARR